MFQEAFGRLLKEEVNVLMTAVGLKEETFLKIVRALKAKSLLRKSLKTSTHGFLPIDVAIRGLKSEERRRKAFLLFHEGALSSLPNTITKNMQSAIMSWLNRQEASEQKMRFAEDWAQHLTDILRFNDDQLSAEVVALVHGIEATK